EDAGIKIGSVASDIMGVSSRDMIEALIDGERRGAVLAGLARGGLRSKIPDLSMALTGRFNDHHALMCRLHLRHVDELTELIDTVEKQIGVMLVPFRAERDLLMTIPGIGPAAAAVIISEIAAAMSFSPAAAPLASWAGLAPASNEPGGRRRPAGTRHGNQHLASVLIECAWSCSRTKTRPGAQFHRLVRRFGGHRKPAGEKESSRRRRPHPHPDHLHRARPARALRRTRRGLLHPPPGP